MVDSINGDGDNGTEDAKVPHLNVPVSSAFLDALAQWVNTHELPIGSESGDNGRPSQGYAVMFMLSDEVNYDLTDTDRTAGRVALSEDERKLKAMLANAGSRADLLAALKAAGISL